MVRWLAFSQTRPTHECTALREETIISSIAIQTAAYLLSFAAGELLARCLLEVEESQSSSQYYGFAQADKHQRCCKSHAS